MAFQYVTVNSGGMSTHYHARSLKNVRVLELKNSGWKRINNEGGIYRGKWIPEVREYASKMGIAIDMSKRLVLSERELRKRKFKDFVFNLNPELIVKLQRLLSVKK